MVKIQTKGFDELIKKLQRAGDDIAEEVDAVFENTAKEYVSRAKRDAESSTDTGFLKGEISYRRTGDMSFEIVSGSKYAGYIEFGTKKNYVPIPGFEEEAAAIKGKGEGTLADFKDNILQWVKRKSISLQGANGKQLDEKQTANLIMYKILVNGIPPKPYFFKQVRIAQDQLEKDLKQMGEHIFK